jgi:ribosomal protein S18 acetylase RimI-like enzyme
MVEPSAHIRAFEAVDDKLVRFVIGKANLGTLAVANRQAYAHPLTISLWIAVSCIFVQVMHWWPKSEFGWWGYLSPVPAFGSTAVPVMFLIDWLNRPFFEKLAQDALRRPDILNIQSYYARSPFSGLWILEYGETFVGLIALDASLDSESDDLVTSETKSNFKKGTSRTATIRHFYVEEQFRGIGMQKDLLDHAVRHAFSSNSTVRTIKAADSPLAPYVRVCLRSAGFQLQKHTETVGVFAWKLGQRILERDDWKKAGKQ